MTNEQKDSRSRLGFSFQFKLLVGIVSLLVLAGIAALSVIQRLVAENYRQLLQEQFVKQSRQFRADREAQFRNLEETFGTLSGNPRMVAAYGARDFQRFYYDFVNQTSRLMAQNEDPNSPVAPFLRFVEKNGTLVPPPPSSRDNHGLWIPFEEGQIAKVLVPLRSTEKESYEELPRFGYIHITLDHEDGPAESVLLAVLAYPMYNNLVFIGDAIFGYPVDGSISGDAAYSGLWAGGHFFSSRVPEGLRLKIDETLNTSQSGQSIPIEWEDTKYLAFVEPISTDSRFSNTSQVILFSLAQQQALLADIFNTMVAVASIVLIVAILLSILFSKQITRTIARLVAATQRIRKGDYDFSLQVTSNDEVGRLTEAFNEMTEGLMLKERYRSVLDKVTDPKVAEALTTGNLELGGEDRNITVLFCDIRGFTPLTEHMSPREVITMLNDHMTVMTRIVSDFGGVVDKFIGDEVMVVFGAPQSHGNEARNAVECARRMLEERINQNAIRSPQFGIGIGVATGPALAGCMGSMDRLNYTVLGPTVNLASRLCSAALPGQVRIDQATFDAIQPTPDFGAGESLQLKGFTRSIMTYTFNSSATAIPPSTR